MTIETIPVYKFHLADGTEVGCGTKVEFDYWTEQGVFEGYVLGEVLCHEPASEDERRKAAWAKYG